MARSTMANLITRVRDLTGMGTADWTDDKVQDVLDANRREIRRERLAIEASYDGGTAYYYDFFSRYDQFEETDAGTAVFVVEDSQGSNKGTADWTANYVNGAVTFSVDQAGSAIYLTGRSYDIYRTASQVLRQQAGAVAGKYSFEADGHSFDRSDWFKHLIEMANRYDQMAKPTSVSIPRVDLAP